MDVRVGLPLRGVKGVKTPMEFGDDSGLFSWPCRKKGPHLAMMGASRGFSPAAAPGKSGLHARGEGERQGGTGDFP